MDERQAASEIEQEAARWVIRLDREGRTMQAQAELDAWLAEDTRRAGALLQAEAAWALLDRGGLLRATATVRKAGPYRRRGTMIGLLAALAASVAVISLQWNHWLGRDDADGAHAAYASERGQVRQVPFADGSSATLNALTRLEVEYRPRLRAVTLDTGEAWFDVAKNPSRPFVVSAGQAHVRAVGTSFAVQRDHDRVDVRVTEGVVEVWASGREADKVRVGAGGSVRIDHEQVLPPEQHRLDEINRRLQWRNGKIDLAGQTLAQAVEQFNRHGGRTLVIVDPALAREPLHGVFVLDDAEAFAHAVQKSLDVPVDFSRNDRILIGKPPAPEPGK